MLQAPQHRNARIVERLNELGMDITLDEIEAEAGLRLGGSAPLRGRDGPQGLRDRHPDRLRLLPRQRAPGLHVPGSSRTGGGHRPRAAFRWCAGPRPPPHGGSRQPGARGRTMIERLAARDWSVIECHYGSYDAEERAGVLDGAPVRLLPRADRTSTARTKRTSPSGRVRSESMSRPRSWSHCGPPADDATFPNRDRCADRRRWGAPVPPPRVRPGCDDGGDPRTHRRDRPLPVRLHHPRLRVLPRGGGFLSITLIPILAAHIEREDGGAANEAFTAVFRTVAVILGSITLAAGLATGRWWTSCFPR
jgi:hypothetical protein